MICFLLRVIFMTPSNNVYSQPTLWILQGFCFSKRSRFCLNNLVAKSCEMCPVFSETARKLKPDVRNKHFDLICRMFWFLSYALTHLAAKVYHGTNTAGWVNISMLLSLLARSYKAFLGKLSHM